MKTRTVIAGSILLAYSTGALFFYTVQKIFSTTLQYPSESLTTDEGIHHSRNLLESKPPANCSPAAVESFPRPFIPADLSRHGSVVVYIIIALYAFLALTIVTEEFFLCTLERIVEVLNLNPDVAAATFMAAGSSAPELGTGLLAVFVTKDDIGVGTVVGSAVYNVAFVVALCGLFAGKVIYMSWWPLCRDCFFYFASIIALLAVMWDRVIEWSDSLILLLLYFTYIGFMYFNEKFERYFTNLPSLSCFSPNKIINVEPSVRSRHRSTRKSKHISQVHVTDSTRNGHVEIACPEQRLNIPDLFQGAARKKKIFTVTSYTVNEVESSSKEETWESPLRFPEGKLRRLLWIISLPLLLLFTFTIPNCQNERWKNWFVIAFLISCAWISCLTYVLVWMITIVGDVWKIPDAVMGLTFLAAGASVPDTLASVFVARGGKGNMAISNAVGSNVFDILICLGLPWFLHTAVVKPGSKVPVYAGGMIYTIMCLIATILFLLIATHVNGWKLNKKLGVAMLIWYLFFMLFTILYQMNIFSHDNLPTCQT